MSTSDLTIIMSRTRAATKERLSDFANEADHLIQTDPLDGFRRCGALLESIARNGVFADLINTELDGLLNETDYLRQDSSDDHLIVWKTPNFTLAIRSLRTPQRQDRLFGHPCSQILTPLNPSGMKFSRYYQPQPQPNDVFDRSRRLVFRGQETVAFGQSCFFEACEDIFLIKAHSHEQTPPILAVFVSPDKYPIRWEYDSVTLAPLRAIAADNSASRLEFVISMMSVMNDRSSLPTLENLSSEHPAHFVRWAAVQAIFRLDRERGTAALRKAVADRHEHVRNAASRSLTDISAVPALEAESERVFTGDSVGLLRGR